MIGQNILYALSCVPTTGVVNNPHLNEICVPTLPVCEFNFDTVFLAASELSYSSFQRRECISASGSYLRHKMDKKTKPVP